jgi:hypothetical protein
VQLQINLFLELLKYSFLLSGLDNDPKQKALVSHSLRVMWITLTILEEEARCLGDFSRPDPLQLHYMYSVLHFVLGPGIYFIYMEIVTFSEFKLYMPKSPLLDP